VEDTSQSPATVTGVISDAVAADLVVVHGIASQDIVADITSHTTITDWAQGPISLQEITEGDVVTVQGIIDRALGEITVTDSLTRYVP
jgi:hypothetical protein